jgi:hypothetical protein
MSEPVLHACTPLSTYRGDVPMTRATGSFFERDARTWLVTNRGTSGAPVVARARHGALARARLPWRLLGVHASRMDMGSRDRELDESLGLNAAWYADVLLALTRP